MDPLKQLQRFRPAVIGAAALILGFAAFLWLAKLDIRSIVTTLTAQHEKDTVQSPPPTYTAFVIETQVTSNLIPIMLHFSAVLGPTWKVLLFTSEETWEAPAALTFRRAVAAGDIEVRFLPQGTVLNSSLLVSRFLSRPWLWEQLRTAPRTLMFQTDSIICSKSTRGIDDFLDYDFVGAPIASEYGQGYNGGLSIRNPRLFLHIARMAEFVDGFEDQWFYEQAKERGARLPAIDVAKTFSVETIYYPEPFGYHQAARWQADHMSDIEEWCPEVKMLIGRRSYR